MTDAEQTVVAVVEPRVPKIMVTAFADEAAELAREYPGGERLPRSALR
ncbi:MAG: hypothetical protein WB586_10740 [Chthoniobacterales bacterium]